MNEANLSVICRLADLAGYQVAVATSKVFAGAFPDRIFKSPLLELMIKSGRNGNRGSMSFLIIPTFVQGTFCVNIINDFLPWLSLFYQAKTMGKVTTCMKRVASQNLILQYNQSSRSLEDYAISCPMERFIWLSY